MIVDRFLQLVESSGGSSGVVFSDSEQKELLQRQRAQHLRQTLLEASLGQPKGADPVYLEDERVFENLLLKERQTRAALADSRPSLRDQTRHTVLSWMLRICEQQLCQDEIFPLASMLLDNFLHLQPMLLAHPDDQELEQRPTTVHKRLAGNSLASFAKLGAHENAGRGQQEAPKTVFPRAKGATASGRVRDTRKGSLMSASSSACSCSSSLGCSSCWSASPASSLGAPLLASSAELEPVVADERMDSEPTGMAEHQRSLMAAQSPAPLQSSLVCHEQCEQLKQRQLILFAACALLLAAKLRQTPRLYVQTLMDFSRLELPVELARDEILQAELLMLASLKWDLAALVTPNDYLPLLGRRCARVVSRFLGCGSGARGSCSSAAGSPDPKQAEPVDAGSPTRHRHTMANRSSPRQRTLAGPKHAGRVRRARLSPDSPANFAPDSCTSSGPHHKLERLHMHEQSEPARASEQNRLHQRQSHRHNQQNHSPTQRQAAKTSKRRKRSTNNTQTSCSSSGSSGSSSNISSSNSNISNSNINNINSNSNINNINNSNSNSNGIVFKNSQNNACQPAAHSNRGDESRVQRHTQTLLELCLMGEYLFGFQSSF